MSNTPVLFCKTVVRKSACVARVCLCLAPMEGVDVRPGASDCACAPRARAQTYAGPAQERPSAQALANALRTIDAACHGDRKELVLDVQPLPASSISSISRADPPPRPATPPPSFQARDPRAAAQSPRPQPRPTGPPPVSPRKKPFSRTPSGLRHSSSSLEEFGKPAPKRKPTREDFDPPDDMLLSVLQPSACV